MSRKIEWDRLSEFGKRIESIRIERCGYSRNVFAEKLNIAEKTYRKWISDDYGEEPCISDLQKIRAILKEDTGKEYSIDYLLGNIDETSHPKHYICDKTGLTQAAVEKLEKSVSRYRQMVEFVPYVEKLNSDEGIYLGEEVNNNLMIFFVVNSILEDETIIRDIFNYLITDKLETVSLTYDEKVMTAVNKYRMRREKYEMKNRIEDFPDFSDLEAWADRGEQKAIINFCNEHNIAIPDEDAIWHICCCGQKVAEDGDISINSNVRVNVDVVKQALIRRVQDGLDRIKKRDLLQRLEVPKKTVR